MADIQLVGIGLLVAACFVAGLGAVLRRRLGLRDEPAIGAIDSLFHLRGLARLALVFFVDTVIGILLPIALGLVGLLFVLTP